MWESYHSVHRDINPPLEAPPSFLPNPVLNLQTFQVPPFRQSPLYRALLPLKIGFFSEAPQFKNFPSLIPSYLLKVTKFLVKISQFNPNLGGSSLNNSEMVKALVLAAFGNISLETSVPNLVSLTHPSFQILAKLRLRYFRFMDIWSIPCKGKLL